MKFESLFNGRVESGRDGTNVGAGDDGRLDGRKKEGCLRTFIVIMWI
jgi:hypothetical protein